MAVLDRPPCRQRHRFRLKVVRQYYYYNSFFNLTRAVYISTYSLFLTDVLGLPVAWSTYVFAINLFATMLFEIPTGAHADVFGRRGSFLLACLATLVGYCTYVMGSLAQSQVAALVWVLTAEIFLAVGFTFYSGALEAWVVDLLMRRPSTGVLQRVFSTGQWLKNIIYAIGGVLGVAAFYGPRAVGLPALTFLLGGLLCLLLFVHAYWNMVSDRGCGIRDHNAQPQWRFRAALGAYARQVAQGVRIVRTDKRIALLIVCQSMAFLYLQVLVFFWPFFLAHEAFARPYPFGNLSIPTAISLSWVAVYGARSAGNRIAGSQGMIRRPLFGITIATCLNAIPMTILAALAHANFLSLNANGTALVCIASYITVRLGEGIGDPLRQVLLNRLLTKETRSTILSLASMCCMLVSAVGVVAVAGLLALDLSISTVWAGIAVLQVFILPLYAVALNNARKGS